MMWPPAFDLLPKEEEEESIISRQAKMRVTGLLLRRHEQ